MKSALLQWLVCPKCKNNLNIQILQQRQNEIIEGTLSCKCGSSFQINNGIPRMLVDGFLNVKKKETMDRFGYEWIHFNDYSCDNFTNFIDPLPDNFFENKIGLDAGCGAGRHIQHASRLGAEMIGVDLSDAVLTAYQKNIHNQRIHIVQADIYQLPFREQTFDFIYSLGVLHHLPKPEEGFDRLIPLLKSNGAIFIWLYAYAFRKVALEALRVISLRLSNPNLRRMAYLCALIDYGIFINLYSLLNKIDGLNRLVNKYAPLRIKEYALHGFKVSYTDWFDRLSAPLTNYYKQPQLLKWINHHGIDHTQLKLIGDSWWWLYGERKFTNEYPDCQH